MEGKAAVRKHEKAMHPGKKPTFAQGGKTDIGFIVGLCARRQDREQSGSEYGYSVVF